MKVKLVYSKNLSDLNGAATMMRTHFENISYYAQNGVDFSVLSRDTILKPKKMGEPEQRCSGFIQRLKQGFTDILLKFSPYSPTAAFFHDYIYTMRPAKPLNDLLSSYIEDDDIIFFNELVPCYYYLKKYGRRGNRIVVVIHNDGEDFKSECNRTKGFEKSWAYRDLMKKQDLVINQVDRIGFVSEMSATRFLELHPGVDKSKVFFIRNGMKTLPYIEKPKLNTFEIVCVGGVDERKNQKAIVLAMLKLKNESKNKGNIHFSIVGDGKCLEMLKRQVETNSLSDCITFVGASKDIGSFLDKADIFMLPSKSEGMPMAILEAMRKGLPIVSTSTGEIPKMIIDKKTGLLIEPTCEGVYEVLNHISDYDWRKMGKASYELFIENFSLKRMLDSYINIFNSLQNDN